MNGCMPCLSRLIRILLLTALACQAGSAGAAEIAIFAHRGFHLNCPENSLASLQSAMDLGLAGSEVDLRTSKDGHVVLLHDPKLERTTNGQGNLAGLPLAQLQRLRLKDGKGKLTDQPIPTLDQILDLIAKSPSFELVLDMKQADPAQVARQVLAKKLAHRVTFFIADPKQVRLVRTIQAVSPELQISVDLLTWWKIEDLSGFVVRSLGVQSVFASEWFFPRCGFSEAKKAGARVMVYLWGTDNLGPRLKRAVSLGADGISNDRPDLLMKHLKSLTNLKLPE